MLKGSNGNFKTATIKLFRKSLLDFRLNLATFSFSGVSQCLTMFSIFSVESMQLVSFAISRTLEKCFWNLIRNPSKTTSAIKTAGEICEKSLGTTCHYNVKDWKFSSSNRR